MAHELNTPIGNNVTVASTLVDNSRVSPGTATRASSARTLNNHGDSLRRAAELLLANLQRAAGLVSSFKRVRIDQTSEQRRRARGWLRWSTDHGDAASAVAQAADRDPPRHPCPGWCLTVIPVLRTGDRQPCLTTRPCTPLPTGGERGVIRIGGARPSDGVEVVVSDDGVGIPPTAWTASSIRSSRRGFGRGSGLVSNIVYNIVTGMLGGRIRGRQQARRRRCLHRHPTARGAARRFLSRCRSLPPSASLSQPPRPCACRYSDGRAVRWSHARTPRVRSGVVLPGFVKCKK